MRLVIDDKIPYIRGLAEQLGETVYRPGAEISADDVSSADALIIRTRTHCDEKLLQGSRVRFIATATIGFDHLDTRYLQQAGISWANCPGCNARSVAQYVESTLLALFQEGRLPDPRSLCVGIVGVGHVGSAVARVLHELGCRLLLCDPHGPNARERQPLPTWPPWPARPTSLPATRRLPPPAPTPPIT